MDADFRSLLLNRFQQLVSDLFGVNWLSIGSPVDALDLSYRQISLIIEQEELDRVVVEVCEL